MSCRLFEKQDLSDKQTCDVTAVTNCMRLGSIAHFSKDGALFLTTQLFS